MTLPLSMEDIADAQVAFWNVVRVLPADRPIRITKHGILHLQETAAQIYGVSVDAICGKARTHRVVRARHWVFYRAYMAHRTSTPETGRRTGGRDHSTVIDGAIAHAMRHGLPMPGARNPDDCYPTKYEGPEPTLEAPWDPVLAGRYRAHGFVRSTVSEPPMLGVPDAP